MPRSGTSTTSRRAPPLPRLHPRQTCPGSQPPLGCPPPTKGIPAPAPGATLTSTATSTTGKPPPSPAAPRQPASHMDAFSPDMVQWARQQSAHALENREAAVAKWMACQAEQKAKQVAKATPKSWDEIKALEASYPATAAPSMMAKISEAADSVMASGKPRRLTLLKSSTSVCCPLPHRHRRRLKRRGCLRPQNWRENSPRGRGTDAGGHKVHVHAALQ
jgi:hypothetical protein